MSAYDLSGVYDDVATGFAIEAARTLQSSRERIEHCLNQLDDGQIWWRPRPEMNAIGNLILHLCGNTGQWIVSATRNEPSNRNRPAEFAQREPLPKTELISRLRDAVADAESAITSVRTPAKLLEPCRVQGIDTNLLTAIFHSVSHFEGHAQEIIGMTRQLLGNDYILLWKPKTPEQVSASGNDKS